MVTAPAFGFDAGRHEYVDRETGLVYPHITGLLKWSGDLDDRWFTQESRVRGTAVHRLTAEYDLGGHSDPVASVGAYKPYLLAHIAMRALVQPTILRVEEPMVHPGYRFGGRPDRIVRLLGVRGSFEIKSGEPTKAHKLQAAFQCLLDSMDAGIPPEALGRWAAYYTPDGRFRIRPFEDAKDFARVRDILREYHKQHS